MEGYIMAEREFYIGSVGPLFYDDNEQSRAVVDEGETYVKEGDLVISKASKTVVTSVDFSTETVTTETITYVTDVTINK